MLIYLLYEEFIKEGDDELVEYFGFVFFSLLCLPIDLILSPLEILALILYKIIKNRR